MAKRLKVKLSRVFPSLQFCRSKRPSAFAVPTIYRLSPVNPKAFDIGFPDLPAPPPSTPEHRFTKCNLSSKIISVGCGSCRSGSCKWKNDIPSSEYGSIKSPEYSWKKEAARWYVVPRTGSQAKGDQRKIYDASSDDGASPVWVKQVNTNTARRMSKTEKNKVVSVSSRDSGCFSSEEDEDEETETVVSSSRSFSEEDYSSELDRSMERAGDSFSNSENKGKKKKVNTNIQKIRRLRRQASMNNKGSNKTMVQPPAEDYQVRRMTIPRTVGGMVKESVAVVKKSVDPHDDFKQSMWEMILAKQMYEAKELEQLLQCFLSLNSRRYHATIVEAFSEIWEVQFSDFPVKDARIRSGGGFKA